MIMITRMMITVIIMIITKNNDNGKINDSDTDNDIVNNDSTGNSADELRIIKV